MQNDAAAEVVDPPFVVESRIVVACRLDVFPCLFCRVPDQTTDTKPRRDTYSGTEGRIGEQKGSSYAGGVSG